LKQATPDDSDLLSRLRGLDPATISDRDVDNVKAWLRVSEFFQLALLKY
jgi:hypothetical protein